MESILSYHMSSKNVTERYIQNISGISLVQSSTRTYHRRRPPKNLRYPRRPKLPPEPLLSTSSDLSLFDQKHHLTDKIAEEEEEDSTVFSSDEIEAISCLFRGRIPQKPGNLHRERPLPLPLPHKLRPPRLPSPKKHVKMSFSLHKNPAFLVDIAQEIRSLHVEQDASMILNKWAPNLRKGSLSFTIRELGRMGRPDRALQTFCWAQKKPHLFPDDRILSSTIEVLASAHELKIPFNLEMFSDLASKNVIEAMARGFIRGGCLNLALKLVFISKNSKRMLDPSIYAMLILQLGKNPDKEMTVLTLLDDLAERDDLRLSQQDCTSIMKVCIRLKKFEVVESLFNWFKQSGFDVSVVMYTTLIHSRYSEKKYKEALAVVWEMEASNCLFDIPAYRVVIKLFVALNDLPRTARYFSKLKEAGFSPTYDIYRELIKIYLLNGRLAKCKEVCKELETAGFKLNNQTRLRLLQLEGELT